MIGVVPALNAHQGVHDRGFTFVGAKGPGEDLFVSFHALRLAAQRRAAHYLASGLQPGDRVALIVPEGEHFIPAFLGGLWAGLIPVPLYPPVSLGKLDAFMDALVSILNVARPRVLVTTDRVGKVLWSAVGRIPSIEKVLGAEELSREPASALPPAAEVKDGDVAFLQFTSGSTALPKGVMVTHGSLAANCSAIVHEGLQADLEKGNDVAVSWLPLYHDMGLIGFVIAPICYRIPTVFIPTLSFIKNATLWMETLSRHKGTMTFAPNFAYALVTKRAKPEQIARWDLSPMRVFGCGAEPINAATLRAFVEAMKPAGLRPEAMLPCYGMAEATLAMSFMPLHEPVRTDRIDPDRYHADRKAVPVADGGAALEVVNCGRTFSGHEICAQDEHGGILPDRQVGELCFRGPSVSAGYWENPEATRAAFRDGWLHTGDLGYVADGEVYVSGRIKDILIVNGRNYYPQGIEWVVDEIPGVRRGSSVVFTRPGKASEEVVVAVESRAADQAAQALKAQIVTRVSEEFQLAVADVALAPPGTLPKTSSGKLQRRKTREQYLAGTIGRAGRGGSTRLSVARYVALSFMGRARHEVRKLFGG
ncbi:MAG TPA: fatty acyl-AMP ligase [Myxococcales bacterium]|nr:fatty acyl-AMP ligase [Myxococcales bacterium]